VRHRPTEEKDRAFDVSVVICAFSEGRWECLLDCLASVQRQTIPPREVLVVVDHNDRLRERLQRSAPHVAAIPNTNDRGAGGARNTGVAAATSSIVAFLDDDAIAEPDWIEQMREPMSDPTTLGVGGDVVPRFLAPMPRWFPREFGWVIGCSYRGLPQSTSPVRNLMACNMAVRRDVFFALGGFRGGHGNVQFADTGAKESRRRRFVTRQSGCEETDLCIRALRRWPQSGWVYHPPVRVHHQVPRSRLTWRYFLARCNDEGLAKAMVVVRFSGATLGLASERTYVAVTLAAGVRAGLRDLANGDVWGLARSVAIVSGALVTALAYVRGSLLSSGLWPLARRARSQQ
jgi:glycosyltransferase involved in cell wall biosynthesis